MIDHELVRGGINLNYTILSEDPNYRILETLTFTDKYYRHAIAYHGVYFRADRN